MEVEDLEVHQAMLEEYYVQPSRLWGHNLPYSLSEGFNPSRGTNALVNSQERHTLNKRS